jgi:signal transduction histidine kinase
MDKIKQRILIVDDEPCNLRVMQQILQGEYQLFFATNGVQALKAVTTEPDLILLDIMMPEMDGYEVCRRLKQEKNTKDIPVLFVTAMDDVEDETKGLALGAVDYIRKPVSPSIVLARVKNHLLLKKQYDQIKKSISIMEHQAEILQQKADLGIQTGGLAHDINNILATCMLVELIPDYFPENFPEREELQKDIDLVMESLRLGRDICQGYTSYLKDIGSKAEIQPVLPLLQPIDMYSRKVKGEIIKDFADDLPLMLCKGYQIKQVLVNIFTNAYQAIEVQDKQVISVKVWSADGQVYFSVHDNGPGISADVLPHIFEERFTTKENGTGLGLFMVKEIVDNHHGTINVESREAMGTTITLSFPAAGEQDFD